LAACLAGAPTAILRRLKVVFTLVMLGAPLGAQQPITLQQAVEIALQSNPIIEAADAGSLQAEAGIGQARSRLFPRVQFSESLMRSNNPVFAFGSLLNQRQFGENNFEVSRLNHPEAINNFQSRLSVEQLLFDSRRTKHAIQAARLRHDISEQEKQSSEADVILAVVRNYFGLVLAGENLSLTRESLRTAQADLKRAQDMFDTGMTTEADVLSVRVHLAAVEEEGIRAENALHVAHAALNDALGVPLERAYEAATPLTPPLGSAENIEVYEQKAVEAHPELRQAGMHQELAQAEVSLARTGYWPEIVAQGILESDRQRIASRGGGNWLAGVSLRWNLWDGSETRSRVAAARYGKARADALGRQAHSTVQLEIRRAYFDLQSAAKRVAVAAASVSHAAESHRIVQNRYQAGLTTVTELIRSQTALMVTQNRHLGALYDQRVAAASLERAAGSLTTASEVLQ
jgi:outer membrane protein TolC